MRILVLDAALACANVALVEQDQIIAARTFKRTARIDHGVFTFDASMRSLAAEFPATAAPAAASALTALSKQGLYILAPPGYQSTPQDVAAMMAT